MILNPYTMLKKGCIIQGSEECLAQNGYDLRIETICEVTTDLDSILAINVSLLGAGKCYDSEYKEHEFN